jgi:geranylgeranyl diphosphate synthase type II
MDLLQSIYARFENHLKQSAFNGTPASIYEPINYLMQLGGKRLRPIALLLAYRTFKDDWEQALDLAMAIEVFHNFTLAHDDIMDEALLRRGKPTMHVAYNTNTAILAGDLMFILSYQLICGDGTHPALPQILYSFNKGAKEICEGQQLDMEFEQMEEVNMETYENMIRLKTAVLLGVAMEIGALLGGAEKDNAKCLYDFAVNLGMAFQIQDDWLDAYGEAAKVGKQVGGDIIRNKKTFLWTCFMQHASGQDKQSMKKAMAIPEPDAKVYAVLALFDQYQVQDKVIERQKYFYDLAMAALDKVEEQGMDTALRHFADVVMNRSF